MSRLRIRRAAEADASVVAALLNALNSLEDDRPVTPMTAEAARRDLLGDSARAWLRLAELDGEVVGFATANAIYDATRQAMTLMLLDLYVDAAARRRGAARALMAALAAEARASGAASLWWGVDEGDEEAMLFYRAIGARSEGRFSSEILDGTALERLAAEAA